MGRNRMIVLVAAVVTSAVLGLPAGAAQVSLEALRWHKRPVVVVSDSPDDPRVARQISALDRTKADVEDRDIEIVEEGHPGGALRRWLGVSRQGFAVVLVGRDGSVKRIWHEPVDPRQIFHLIDQMPMRREEMRRR